MKKTELFEDQQQELSLLAKVLSHPARLAILEYIANCQTCISGDISDEIPLSRTTVSQHLQELKKHGFIKGEVEGLKIHYCMNNERIQEISDSFSNFFQKINIQCNSSC